MVLTMYDYIVLISAFNWIQAGLSIKAILNEYLEHFLSMDVLSIRNVVVIIHIPWANHDLEDLSIATLNFFVHPAIGPKRV